MLKALILEMNGIIVDNEYQHYLAAKRVLEIYGVTLESGYYNHFAGSSARNFIRTCIYQFKLDCNENTLLEEWNQERCKIIAQDGYQPLPGVIDLIKRLARAGIRLSIASSANWDEIRDTTKSLQIQEYFEQLISINEASQIKPSPHLLKLTLKKMGIHAKEAMVIDNSYNGVEAAIAAHLPCIGFLNSHFGQQNLCHADYLLESFDGLNVSFFYHVYQRYHNLPLQIASTSRLSIRELKTEDLPKFYQICESPEVRPYITGLLDFRREELDRQQAYIQYVYHFYGYGLWGIFLKNTNTIIGGCGFENHKIEGEEEIMLSYLLDKNYRRQGYALESCRAALQYANEEMDIHRVVAAIRTDNTYSKKLADHLGMKAEREVIFQKQPAILYSISL